MPAGAVVPPDGIIETQRQIIEMRVSWQRHHDGTHVIAALQHVLPIITTLRRFGGKPRASG